jgi:hypothetical protein
MRNKKFLTIILTTKKNITNALNDNQNEMQQPDI